MTKTLTVYKASAGSGKTFTLAVEYIKLLLVSPRAYEGILAVTFTNKATEEMKMRILSQLYGLSHGLPSSDGYMNVIVNDTGFTPEYVRSQAGKALTLLLHNYHNFRVQTIDTFFQGVLRNLAKELQINANLRIGLNNEQVVEQAVDDIIDSLADDHALLRTVVGYMENQMQEHHHWNIIGSLKRFGANIFSELYKKNRDEMETVTHDKDFFTDYRRQLEAIKAEAEGKYTEVGREVMATLDNEGLTAADFCQGSRGVYNYFAKMAGGRFRDEGSTKMVNSYVAAAMEKAENWVTKAKRKDAGMMEMIENCLLPLLRNTEQNREYDAKMCKSADVTLRHLNDVSLLGRIEASAHNLNEAAQRFMLSDTQCLLHEMIDGSDSPFIFEKTGARLEHIMIDEFQDTSIVQWENFRTLLNECMSRSGDDDTTAAGTRHNLIVGDVKQSIYRFRQGDWRLLNDIEALFSADEIDMQSKKTNWRSERNVIAFNNAFFQKAAAIEADNILQYSVKGSHDIAKAYADVAQEIPGARKPKGMVHIEMLPAEMLEEMQQRTLDILLDLLSIEGIRQRDIAILVRYNNSIPLLANFIEDSGNGIKVVSAEAFRLDASQAVCTIVEAMRVLARPTDTLAAATLSKHLGGELPEAFTAQREKLLAMTLHDMAEELVRMFHIDENTDEAAYVTAFFDHLHSFTNDMAPVLEDFLHAWDDDIAGKTIETADCDGVRIMSIHKSKGLEFRHVILPYCNWSHEPKRQTIWVKPTQEPFSRLPMVPVDYFGVKSLEGSIYEDDGINEFIQNTVDNLNLLYVAMTRARESLFIIGERIASAGSAAQKNRSKVIDDVIGMLPSEIEGLPVHIDNLDDPEAVLTLTYGSIAPASREEEKAASSGNVFEAPSESVSVGINSFSSHVNYRQSNDSRRFANDATDETDRQRYIRIGTVMHQLFATIRTLDDVKPALERMEYDGMLYDEKLTREELISTLREKFSNKQVKEWFSPHWTVYNECSIITPEGEYRPDRVVTDGKETIVIDFKFGKPNSEHHTQVQNYMSLLKDMQMPNVKGFLWYVNSDKVESV